MDGARMHERSLVVDAVVRKATDFYVAGGASGAVSHAVAKRPGSHPPIRGIGDFRGAGRHQGTIEGMQSMAGHDLLRRQEGDPADSFHEAT
ncbi:hypothetical protein JCM30394_29880 [Deferrisoma palaeochoriense]